MKSTIRIYLLALGALVLFSFSGWLPNPESISIKDTVAPLTGRYLYVAVPGIRNYLGYGGHGILVFDMDNDHKFVKRVKTEGYLPNGIPSNAKGVAVSVPLNSIYISTLQSLHRIELTPEKIIWENA